MDDFQILSDNFLDWFQNQAGARFDSRLEIADLRARGAGRGIVARSEIPADTELFIIPRKSLITVENSALHIKLPHLFKSIKNSEDLQFSPSSIKGIEKEEEEDEDDDEDEDDTLDMPDTWLELILVMIYEFLQGSRSKWRPYLDVLPHSFDTPMFWTKEEIEQLQASSVKYKIGKETADVIFKSRILPVIKENKQLFYDDSAEGLSDEELMDLAHRMGSIIMAYAFELEREEDESVNDEQDGWIQDKEGLMAMGMVPMADILNADAEFNAHLNHGDDALTMRSLRAIATGEEILNYYGPLPNCDLLRRYGYTSDKHSRYDIVELPWDLVRNAIEQRFPCLGPEPLDDNEMEEVFVLERDSGEPDDTGINAYPAIFKSFPEELKEQVLRIVAPALGIYLEQGNLGAHKQKDLQESFLSIIETAIRARLAQYSTDTVQDAASLAKTKPLGREAMAITVRMGEKRLLQEAIELILTLRTKRPLKQRKGPSPQAKRRKLEK